MWPRLGILVLLACVAGPTVPRALAASSSPFYTAGVTLNNVTKLVRAGQRVDLDSGPPGADGAYDLRLQLRNTGMRTVAVQSLQTAVYVGTPPMNGSSASGTTTGPLLVVPAQGKLPSLQPGQYWPGGGAPVPIPASALPAVGECQPWNLTLAINSTFTLVNGNAVNQTTQQELVPISISSANCVGSSGTSVRRGPLEVTITSPEHYIETDSTQVPIYINFGERVLQQDPLQLFNVTGTDRYDVVYAVAAGQLYLMLYIPDPGVATPLSVTVPAGVTTNAAGVANNPASFQVYYQPEYKGWQAASYAMSGLLAGTAAASLGTSFLVSALRPAPSAGSLGYGMLGQLLWAQRFFLTGLLGTPHLPLVYRTVSKAFRWTDFSVRRPWVGSGPDVQPNQAFQNLSLVQVNSNAELVYFGDTNGTGTVYESPSPVGSPSSSSAWGLGGDSGSSNTTNTSSWGSGTGGSSSSSANTGGLGSATGSGGLSSSPAGQGTWGSGTGSSSTSGVGSSTSSGSASGGIPAGQGTWGSAGPGPSSSPSSSGSTSGGSSSATGGPPGSSPAGSAPSGSGGPGSTWGSGAGPPSSGPTGSGVQAGGSGDSNSHAAPGTWSSGGTSGNTNPDGSRTSPSPGGSTASNSSSGGSGSTVGERYVSRESPGTWGTPGGVSTSSMGSQGIQSGTPSSSGGTGSGSSGSASPSTAGSAAQGGSSPSQGGGTWGNSSSSKGNSSGGSSAAAPGTWGSGGASSAPGADDGSSAHGNSSVPGSTTGTWGTQGSQGSPGGSDTAVPSAPSTPAGSPSPGAPGSKRHPPAEEAPPPPPAAPAGPFDSVNDTSVGGGEPSQSIIQQIIGGKRRLQIADEDNERQARSLLEATQDYNYMADNTRYILVSSGASDLDSSVVLLSGPAAWAHASAIIQTAHPSIDKYSTLRDVAFWGGALFLLVCLVHASCILACRRLGWHVPGVLYAPRPQLVLAMLVLPSLTQAGSSLFRGGLAPMFVGLAVLLCFPCTFLLLAYLACTAPLYRKEKAVYLVSTSNEKSWWRSNPYLARCYPYLLRLLGMEGYRGEWRSADPASGNAFVFRWGALFEDCRGPPYTYRRLQDPPGTNEREDNMASEPPGQPEDGRGGSTIVRMDDPPKLSFGPHTMHRSVFQLHGTIVALLRLVLCALVIGSLTTKPIAQAALLLVVCVVYIAYLRLVVPYSCTADMAVEYWAALIDAILFSLCLAVATASYGDYGLQGAGIGMTMLQMLVYLAYLINRGTAVIAAWRNLVGPTLLSRAWWTTRRGSSAAATTEDPGINWRRQAGVVATVFTSHMPGLKKLGDDKIFTTEGGVHKDASTVPSEVIASSVAEDIDSQGNTPMATVSPMHRQSQSLPASPSLSGHAILHPFSAVQVHQADPQSIDECQERRKLNTDAPTWIHPIIMRLRRDAAGELAEDHGDTSSALWDRFWRSL